SSPIGTRLGIRPSIIEVPLESGLAAVVFTDGLLHAGERSGKKMDIVNCIKDIMSEGPPDAAHWADHLLAHALELEQNRPSDDISVVVVAILPSKGDEVRRLTAHMPLS
nr:SpoIIE family protein phosphatase [Anaerolineales bacterium]